MRPRKARGCDLALSLATEIRLSGTLPGGAKDVATLRVASIVPFLVMKAMALASRLMEKDAWDIYYCIRYYPGGIDKLVNEFKPHLSNKLVQEALANIAEKFASPEHVGPVHIADFEDVSSPEDRAILQRDAYERIQALTIRLQGEQ
jgi:predicted nucleotidyltransferase